MRSTFVGRAALAALAASSMLAGCAVPAAEDTGTAGEGENEVKVDTRSPLARAQYDANVAFVRSYTARCRTTGRNPRALVTGFGRFMSVADNASGRVVSSLVPDARYPETIAPPAGQIDPPAAQLSVGTTTIDIAGVGPVDVCGMVLPVYWDVASILVAKELDAFRPEVVVMNGVAGPRQPIWLELGSLNRASPDEDGSNHLRPAIAPGEAYAPIVDRAAVAQPNLMTWSKVEAAAEQTIVRLAHERADGVELGEILEGVRLAGFPRTTNTYLCNNVTYATGHLMSHPGKRVTLLRASTKARGVPNQVDVILTADHRATPRMFVHWPSSLPRGHHARGAEILKAMVGAQMCARRDGQAPTPGDNALADPGLAGGTFF